MEISKALQEGRDISICSDCAESNGAVWPKGHACVVSWQHVCHEIGEVRSNQKKRS